MNLYLCIKYNKFKMYFMYKYQVLFEFSYLNCAPSEAAAAGYMLRRELRQLPRGDRQRERERGYN